MTDLPPLTTEDRIVATIVTALVLLFVGGWWALVFVLVWAFTGWKP